MAKLVLLVGSITDISPARHLTKSFIDIGYEVFAVSDESNENVSLVKKRAVDIAKVCQDFQIKPDFMIFVEGGNMNLLPINFESLEFPKYWWAIDTQYAYKKHLLISRLFDHSFIAQKDYVEYLRQDGIVNCSWLPLAYPDWVKTKTDDSKQFDIAYIGSSNWNLYPERGVLLKAISEKFKNNYIGQAKASKMIEIYSNSKLVFNYSLKNDINMRFFEAIGSGAVLITSRIIENGINELFIEDKDFIVFDDESDLINKISKYLENETSLKAISDSGKQKVRNLHTYEIRAKYLADYEYKKDNHSSQKQHSFSDYSAALVQMDFYADAIMQLLREFQSRPLSKQNRLRKLFIDPILLFLTSLLRIVEKVVDLSRLSK